MIAADWGVWVCLYGRRRERKECSPADGVSHVWEVDSGCNFLISSLIQQFSILCKPTALSSAIVPFVL